MDDDGVGLDSACMKDFVDLVNSRTGLKIKYSNFKYHVYRLQKVINNNEE